MRQSPRSHRLTCCSNRFTISVVVPVVRNSRVSLDGDGGTYPLVRRLHTSRARHRIHIEWHQSNAVFQAVHRAEPVVDAAVAAQVPGAGGRHRQAPVDLARALPRPHHGPGRRTADMCCRLRSYWDAGRCCDGSRCGPRSAPSCMPFVKRPAPRVRIGHARIPRAPAAERLSSPSQLPETQCRTTRTRPIRSGHNW